MLWDSGFAAVMPCVGESREKQGRTSEARGKWGVYSCLGINGVPWQWLRTWALWKWPPLQIGRMSHGVQITGSFKDGKPAGRSDTGKVP